MAKAPQLQRRPKERDQTRAPQLQKRPRGRYHIYEIDGVKVPSVSQILSCARKGPGLEWWFSKIVAEEAVDSVGEISNRLKSDGREMTVKWLAGARNRHSSEAAGEGTDIHSLIAAGDGSDPRSAAALRFLSDKGLKVAGTEVCGANVRDGYAGTIDMVAEDPDGNLVVIDWKADTSGDPTKRPDLYPEAARQVAAYSEFDIVNAPFAKVWRKRKSSKPVVVSLRADGTYQAGTVDTDHSEALDGFRACLYMWRATEAPTCDLKSRAHGLYTEEQYRAVARRVDELIQAAEARVDATYYCPHHPEYRGPCDCRKPPTGLYRLAAREHGLEPADSYFVGDKLTDVLPADALGGQGILVRTGYGASAGPSLPSGFWAADDLAGAAELILREQRLRSLHQG